VLMCAILVINLSISVVSNVQCLWSNTTAQRGHHIHIIIINCNDYMEWNTSVRPKWCQHSSNELQTVIIAVQYCALQKCQPRKVGGTKHRASPTLQKVGGTCPPVHPRIYAHVSISSGCSSVFAQITAQCPYTLQWDAPFPSKLPLPKGIWTHLIRGSLSWPEPSTQTGPRSVQPFLQGSLVWQRDRQSDRPTDRSIVTDPQ